MQHQYDLGRNVEVVDLEKVVSKCHATSLSRKRKYNLLFERNGCNLIIWYEVGIGSRKPNKFLVPSTLRLNKETFVTFGLLQAESTKKSVGRLDFSNSRSEIVKYFLEYFENSWKIRRSLWHAKILYRRPDFSTNKELLLKRFWSRTLGLNIENISVQFDNKRKSVIGAPKGAILIYIDNNSLFSVVIEILRLIKRICSMNREKAAMFLSGVLAGDGTIKLNRHGSIDNFGICFNPNSDELNLYLKILKVLKFSLDPEKNIEGKGTSKMIRIYGIDNFIRLLVFSNFNPFYPNLENSIKFMKGFINNQQLRSLSRLSIFRSKRLTIREFSRLSSILPRSSNDLLVRWYRRGYLSAVQIGKKHNKKKPYIFTLSSHGNDILEMIDKSKENLNTLTSAKNWELPNS